MPKTRAQKEEIVNELAQKLSHIKSAVFTTISGYTMEDANALRAKGVTQGVGVVVAKKTLLLRALEKNEFTVDKDNLEGSILTTLGYNDEVSAAKLIADFSKGREGIKMVGGILEGRVVSGAAVTQLASLPSRTELYGKLVGTLNAPISGFVNVLAGNLRNLVYVLNAIKESKA